jgi:hypothetical protein
MDAQFWIYIVIGVIYFLSRLLKKPEQAPDQTEDMPPAQRRSPARSEQTLSGKPRQMTFEELLREITEGKQQPPREERRYESFDNDLGEEAKSLEEAGYDEAEDARVLKAFEDAKSQVFQRSALEESIRLQDTVADFGKLKSFEKKEKRNVLEDYLNIIRNPKGLRQAVVMSEILKRKF